MKYKALFLDIGGVLLNNGWDRSMREKACHLFDLNYEEMNERHALIVDTYETGKLSLDQYLDQVVFFKSRQFNRQSFKHFMFDQSFAYQEMIQLIGQIKKLHQLKVVAVSNEGKELMIHRMNHFKLKELIDFFVCSSFVHLRKPDLDIYYLALNLTQVEPKEVIYIDDRLLLTDSGAQIGMQVIHHLHYQKTSQLLKDYLKG